MDIPLVIIAYETHSFIKQMVDRASKYFKKIIIIDNNSKYPVLLEYYDQLEAQDPEKYKIHRLDTNYGHTVYQKGIVPLPPVYCLSDPDIELNKDIPDTFITDLFNISVGRRAYKVGFALELDEAAFIKENGFAQLQMKIQSVYWKRCIGSINDGKDKLYKAPIDTTFCLINDAYKTNAAWSNGLHIRVAGRYTAKHLPWYEDYIKNNMPLEEYNYWKHGNSSSSFLQYKLKVKDDVPAEPAKPAKPANQPAEPAS